MKRDLNDDTEFAGVMALFDAATQAVRGGDGDGADLVLKEILKRMGAEPDKEAKK